MSTLKFIAIWVRVKMKPQAPKGCQLVPKMATTQRHFRYKWTNSWRVPAGDRCSSLFQVARASHFEVTLVRP